MEAPVFGFKERIVMGYLGGEAPLAIIASSNLSGFQARKQSSVCHGHGLFPHLPLRRLANAECDILCLHGFGEGVVKYWAVGGWHDSVGEEGVERIYRGVALTRSSWLFAKILVEGVP